MPKISEVISFIENIYPKNTADEGDNVGLMLGNRERTVSHVLVSLNSDLSAVCEAANNGCELIIAHHPIIYSPLNSITADDFKGRTLLKAAENKIAIYAAHTNLDWGEGGVNDTLCSALGLQNTAALMPGQNEAKVARIGYVENKTLGDFLEITKYLFKSGTKYVGDKKRPIKKVAVCGGGGGILMDEVISQNCDLFISSDFRYHEAQKAYEEGLCLIDGGHFETENVVCEPLAKRLLQQFPDIKISIATSGQYFDYE